MHYLYGLMILIWLSGCNQPEPAVVNNQYTLEECKEELLVCEGAARRGLAQPGSDAPAGGLPTRGPGGRAADPGW